MITLKTKDGKILDDLGDLREKCDVDEIMAFYDAGRLVPWLHEGAFVVEGKKIAAIDKDDKNIEDKICEILGIKKELSAEEKERLKEKTDYLRQKGANEWQLSKAAQTALKQRDLAELWEKKEQTIYLCGEKFHISITKPAKKYIGILGTPKITIDATSDVEIESKGITFENVELPWKKVTADKNSASPRKTKLSRDKDDESTESTNIEAADEEKSGWRGIVGGIFDGGKNIIGTLTRPIYREDKDLEILATADNEDLKLLVAYLTKDKNGGRITTETLTFTDEYRSNPDNPHSYWRQIVAELQCFGGNTAVNKVRGGKGVLYREILCDVCDKKDVKYDKKADVADIESSLLEKIMVDAVEKMDDEQMQELVKTLKLDVGAISHQAVSAGIRTGMLAGGFFSMQVASIIAYELAADIFAGFATQLAGFVAWRGLGFLSGPVGMAALTALAFAGPAYRITVPAVVQVAYIRLKSQNK